MWIAYNAFVLSRPSEIKTCPYISFIVSVKPEITAVFKTGDLKKLYRGFESPYLHLCTQLPRPIRHQWLNCLAKSWGSDNRLGRYPGRVRTKNAAPNSRTLKDDRSHSKLHIGTNFANAVKFITFLQTSELEIQY